MRYFLLTLFLFPLFVNAQDCKLLRDTDPYTKETRLSTGFITLQGATVSIDADKKEIDFFINVPEKCLDDQSMVVVFFEGTKSKVTYRNAGSMNCDGNFHFTARNSSSVTPAFLQKLSTLAVTQLVFTGTDKKPVTISLQPDQQKILQASAVCMATEAKTLVK